MDKESLFFQGGGWSKKRLLTSNSRLSCAGGRAHHDTLALDKLLKGLVVDECMTMVSDGSNIKRAHPWR